MRSRFRPASFSDGRLVGARRAVSWLAVGAFLLAPSPSSQETPAFEEYVVVVSADVPATDVSLLQLRRLFMFRERYWKPGLPVTLIFSADDLDSGSLVLDRIYRMDYAAFRRMLLELIYQQELDLPPKVVASDSVVLDLVGSGRGLISIVRADTVKGRQVRVLSVDGVRAGSDKYALRR